MNVINMRVLEGGGITKISTVSGQGPANDQPSPLTSDA